MNEKINAVCWMFGFTVKEAKDYLLIAPKHTVDTIVESWKNQTKKSFEED